MDGSTKLGSTTAETQSNEAWPTSSTGDGKENDGRGEPGAVRLETLPPHEPPMPVQYDINALAGSMDAKKKVAAAGHSHGRGEDDVGPSSTTIPSPANRGNEGNEAANSVQPGAVRVRGIDHSGNDEETWHSGSAVNIGSESVSNNQFDGIDIHVPEAEPVTPEPKMETAMASILEEEKFGITIFGRRFHILFLAAFLVAVVGAAIALAVIFSSSGDGDPSPPPRTSCDVGEVRFDVNITTDARGNETQWVLSDNEDVPILLGANYRDENTYTAGACLPSPGNYFFEIADLGLNGMCCSFGTGGYEIFLDDESVASGGDFSYQETWELRLDADQVSAFKTSGRPCGQGEIEVEVQITADENGDEIIWVLSDNENDEGVLLGGNLEDETTQIEKACLSLTNSYTFQILDSGGDGLCCSAGEGGYEIFLNGTLFASGGDFGFSDTQEIRFDTGRVTCEPGKITIEVNITTDSFGDETSWDLTDNENGEVIASDGGYASDSTYSSMACLSSNRIYTFTIKDSDGDGMCCDLGDGSYEVHLDGNLVAYGGEFSDDEAWELVLDEDQVRVNYASCEVGEIMFEAKIKTDQNGWETSWVLADDESNMVASVPTFTYGDESTYTTRACLSSQQLYTFTIEDSIFGEGDGICCSNGEGRYELFLGGNPDPIASGGDFSDREEWEIRLDVDPVSVTKIN